MAPLPPLPALRAFEAAARLGGFARAAAALNVSTSAVSHQIRGLEEMLGARLLERSTGAGGVRVTPAGATLLAAAGEALALLEEACADIRGEARRLVISANVSLSTMWLARRLAEFSARHPPVAIDAILQLGEPDFSGNGIDLAIVHVAEGASRPGDEVLFRETVFPVCSPAILATASAGLGGCRLLQEAHAGSPELAWATWAEVIGLAPDFPTRIVHYETFSQAIGAAVGGAGVALGRSPLVDAELESGRLVRLVPDLSRPASWRFVLRRGPSRRHRMVKALVGFLRETAEPLVGKARQSPTGSPGGRSELMTTLRRDTVRRAGA